MWSWWVLVRKWPIPERNAQPLVRFNPIPGNLILLAQACLLAFFVILAPNSVEFESLHRWLFVGDFTLFVSLILGGFSWLAAGLRFHIGTWIFSCGGTGLGLFGIAWWIGSRLAGA